MQLLKHYRNLLAMAGLHADEEGMVRRNGKKDERAKNLFVQNKPVVLPVYEQLSSAGISERLVFHPFAESSSKGESVIVAELRTRFCSNLSFALMQLMMKCVVAGASKAEHHKFNPVQAEMLDCVRKIDEKNAVSIVNFFTKLLGMPEKKNVSMVQIYLSRNGTVGDKDYARAGIVTFPLYSVICDELQKSKDREIEGIKMSEKDLQYIKNLYEYVFPELAKNPHAYNRGSNSDVAPYMDALMRTVAAVQGMINERMKLLESVLEDGLTQLPEDWMDAIDALPSLQSEIIQIPLQPGMDGASRVIDNITQKNQMDLSSKPAPVQIAPVTQAVQAAQPLQLHPHQQQQVVTMPQGVVPQPGQQVIYVVAQPGQPVQQVYGQAMPGGYAAGAVYQPAQPAVSNLHPHAPQNTGYGAPVAYGGAGNKPIWE